MRKIQIVLIAAFLFFVTSAVTAQKVKNTMTNADVIEMVKAGLPEGTIVLAIQQSEPNFDTSTKALIELSRQSVSQKIMDAMLQAQPTKSVPPIKPVDTNAIATKDIGPLRVILKSVLPIKVDNSRMGMRCSFEFINLETQKPIVVAMNARAPDSFTSVIGRYLRSTLIDENGVLWYLEKSDVIGGIGKVGVGSQPNGYYYDPAEIATLLSKRDDLRSDFFANRPDYAFIFGSTTEMLPGQSITFTASFVQDINRSNSGESSKVFQMATEIVVGVLASGTKKSYTLYNLMFDRITVTNEAPTNSTSSEVKSVSQSLTNANSSKDTPFIRLPKPTTNARSLEALSAAIDRGEDVVFKIKSYSIVYPRNSRLSDGLVTVNKTAVTFQPTTDVPGFEVPSDKILKLTYKSSLRVRIKVAIDTKGNKEEKKEFEILNPRATIKRDLLLLNVIVGSEFECVSCDNSMSVLFTLLQKVSGKK